MAAEHDALLEAVCSDPDDDGPRLRFADWLEETGEAANAARAEFIRLQCALARLDEDADDELPLRRRAEALLREHWRDWFRPLCAALGEPSPDPRPAQARRGWFGRRRQQEPPQPAYSVDGFRIESAWVQNSPRPALHWVAFRRGFVEEVALPPEERVDSAYLRRLTSAAPVRRLTFGAGDLRPPPWSWPDGSPCERLQALDVYFGYYRERERGQETVRRVLTGLVTSPYLPSLTGLRLRGATFTAELLRPLLDAPLLRRLTELDLSADPSAVRALAESPAYAKLAVLDLSGIYTDREVPEALARLAEAPRYRSGLRRLVIDARAVAPESIRDLTEVLWFRRLTELRLVGANSPEAITRLLAALPPTLRRLDLRGQINDQGTKALAECPRLNNLRRLDLSRNWLRGAALDLARSPYLENLRYLDLRGNPLSDRVRAVLRERFGERVELSPADFP